MIDDPAKKALAIARDATGKNNLPMDQKSRLKRARAMGFDTKKVYYHGTDQDIKQFDPVSPQGHFGVYISKDPMIADVYATKNQYNEPPTYGGNIMPLYAKKNAPIQTNQMAGYYKVNHPSELRSIHANFDPNEINNLDIMKSNGGMIDNPDKAIRRAVMVAKGLAKEIGPLPTGDHPKPPHPASMIPGVHVTGMGDEHTAIPDGYADGGDVTSNPNFSQWFGNSVTHDNGVPRTYYTGTSKDKDFTSFNVGRHGAWFTTDPHEASQYAESNDSQGHVWENGRFQPTNTASRVIPAYLKAENPYTGERPEALSRAQNYKKAQSDWFDQLRAAGHDSWMPSSLKGNLAVMLRHPTQIKSAIGNSGAFDPKQKAIHKADGGDVEPTDETGFDAWHGMSDTPTRKALLIAKQVAPEDRKANLAAFMEGNHPLVPQVLYHGTDRDVRSFDAKAKPNFDSGSTPDDSDTGWYSKGFYLTPSRRVASFYADPQNKNRAGANVMPVHLSMKNPYVLNVPEYDSGALNMDKELDKLGAPKRKGFTWRLPSEQTAFLKSKGYDGVIMMRDGVPHEYIAHDPNQIKSAIGNQGTYNLNDNDITKADGGDVEPTDETGFDAWHGTPHTFAPEPGAPLGRFRSDKIGTGEGAQAYGHGLYLGAEGTARAYRQALSGDPITNKGEKPNWQNRGSKSFAQLALAQSLDKKMSGDEAIKDAMQDLHRNGAFSERKDIKQRYYDAVNSLGEMLGKSWKINPGHLYHVRVNANPEHFLDWDKPLSEQHPYVQAALENLHGEKISPTSNLLRPSNKGQQIYYGTAAKHGNYAATNAAPAAESLKQAGIPGIRYLDANSRDPDTDQPTHNHVIFDPSIIDIKHRYARGGDVTQTENSKMPNYAVDHALRIVHGHYSNGGAPVNYRTMFAPQQTPQMTDQAGFTEHAGPVSIGSLSAAFDKAIAHHLSLSPEERIANRKRADAALAPHVGMKKDGKVVPLLGKNAKMMKAETGYKGGEPVLLPDGRGIETTGLALAPSYQEGQFNTCPNSQSCKAECLGKTSGNYFKVGGGSDLSAFEGPRLNSLKKTLAMMRQPEAFAVRLHDEIAAAKREAETNGNILGVRLNVLSDINPRVHKSIIEAHPDVAFYDYTKNNSNPIAPNHHYTYSSTGLTQPEGVNGNPNATVNRFQNWKQMRKRLDGGDNVAMAFSHKRHLPETVHDEETGKIYRVVNGDTHDFRPMDMQPPGADGVIVGLKNKKSTGTMEGAAHESNGFFVHYDPQEAKTTQGTLVRGPSPGLNPETNKPIAGPTVALNKSVIIPNQTAPKPIINNDSKPEQGQ